MEKVNKARILKRIRNVLLGIVVLTVLLVGGGVAYTWYMGQQPVENTAAVAQPVASPAPPPVITPTRPAPDAKVGASVQMITSPIAPGSNASITIKTNPEAVCTIKVVYDKIESKDSGLSPKTANEFGMAEWTWTVEPSVPAGKWPVKVTCANEKHSAMVQGDLVVRHD